MLGLVLRAAMTSPARQTGFRRVAAGHAAIVAILVAMAVRDGSLGTLAVVSQVLLVLGLVEGAALIGWRLVQLPKSPALEFLLVSAVSPRQFFFAELLAGIFRFLLVQLAALPILAFAAYFGPGEAADLIVLAGMPAVWGIVAGVALIAWIYEPKRIRRIGELIAFGGVLIYLIVGVLAAENLQLWLEALPPALGEFLFNLIMGLHHRNPFGFLRYWFSSERIGWVAWDRLLTLNLVALAAAMLMALRAGWRLTGHFHDRHYRPIDSSRTSQSESIGNQPLAWWAVRRVSEYSGRVNLYLALGFCAAYAAYIIAGDAWPAWIGRGAFLLFDHWGGPALVATAMAVMAAVPAIYQFGLWDATVQDRCRRLELLLLTDLSAGDYAYAAFRAALSRGRGYLFAAAMLWVACAISGQCTVLDAVAAAMGSLVLWGFAFALGFRGFATGHQTNGIASLVTLGGPLLLYAFWSNGLHAFAALLPTAMPFLPMKTGLTWHWALGFAVVSSVTFWIANRSIAQCDANLRTWFDANQGLKVTV